MFNLFQNLSNQFQQYKMVIVVRRDLKMSIGKTSAQVAHAALGAYKLSLSKNSDKVTNWENFSGQAKIVLGVENEKELFEIKDKADKNWQEADFGDATDIDGKIYHIETE